MLDIKHLTFGYYKGQQVLSDFNFGFTKGGVYGLLGPNGAGKSTLLYLIAGLLTPATGSVTFNDVNTRRRLPSTLNDIFIVPEEFTLPAISLERYVKLYGSLYPKFDYQAMERYLEIFNLPPDINLGALSMGQKKKAFMSFALACNTSLLLMDEPTNGLDIPGKSAFRRAISAAATDERLIIISTHQVRDIDRILDHILIMDNHHMVLEASVNEILQRLCFYTTTDPAEIERALYVLPNIDGSMIVVDKTDYDNETELNLETLFGFALNNPSHLAAIFARRPAGNDHRYDMPPLPSADSTDSTAPTITNNNI